MTYVAERLVVGVVAVVVLMAVTAIGFASLGRARRYIARELAALGAEPPSGALYGARRAQLVLLRQRAVAPDLELLADATAAAEAERGYTGRYLVATTVLIGLVGTFGGLMETLARATPLLKGDLASGAGGPTAALGLIAGPLAGLHVTFGTSVVAILVTLALTLVQGDVTLHQERLLALLQERTRHVLLPELWPADESAAERTVRALHELRALVAESLTTSAANSAEKIAGVVRVEVQRMVAQVRTETQAATAAQTAALDRTGVVLTDGFRRTADSVAQELRDAAITSRDAMTAAATASREAMTGAAAVSRDALTAPRPRPARRWQRRRRRRARADRRGGDGVARGGGRGGDGVARAGRCGCDRFARGGGSGGDGVPRSVRSRRPGDARGHGDGRRRADLDDGTNAGVHRGVDAGGSRVSGRAARQLERTASRGVASAGHRRRRASRRRRRLVAHAWRSSCRSWAG